MELTQILSTLQTLRLCTAQGAHFLSNYVNDQMKEDMDLEKLVAEGHLTRAEADQLAEEWSEVCMHWSGVLETRNAMCHDGTSQMTVAEIQAGWLACPSRKLTVRNIES